MSNTKTIDVVIRAIESLTEKARTDKRLGEVLLAMLHPLSDTIISAFEKYAEEVRVLESEVGPERARILIEAHDDLIDLTSEDRAAQIEAVKRLARAMIPPKLGQDAKGRLKWEAERVGMGEGQYWEEAIFPDGLILAVGEMASRRTVRLGRKWVLDKDGKASELRPLYDLSIQQFVHWLYQESSKACDASLTQQTYPRDPLNAIQRPTQDLVSSEDEIDKAVIERPGLVVALFNMDLDPIQSRIIAVEEAQEAKRQISTLLKKGTLRERALIEDALNRDGDLSALLSEDGYTPAAIRQVRHRLRRKLSE